MNKILQTALSQYGVTEIVGDVHNPTILKYFKSSGHSWVKDDETAWCSAFINWCAKSSGFKYTGKLNARSWLDIGEELDSPELGDLVIFWRKSKDSVYGHVGLFINEIGDNIYVLGGNQKNMVCIMPYNKAKVLGYRRLKIDYDLIYCK